jgi:uncharacterized membrane protein
MFKEGVKLLGHAVHPMLVVFPLGLLATSVIFDVLHLASGNGYWSAIAYWMIAAGVIGGLFAAAAGLIDWLALPGGTRAKSVGMWHGIGNATVLVLFLASWLLRRGDPSAPSAGALAISLVGVGVAAVSGWLGGELVSRLGVSVDPGANANAPSSLATKQAQAPGGSRRRAAT